MNERYTWVHLSWFCSVFTIVNLFVSLIKLAPDKSISFADRFHLLCSLRSILCPTGSAVSSTRPEIGGWDHRSSLRIRRRWASDREQAAIRPQTTRLETGDQREIFFPSFLFSKHPFRSSDSPFLKKANKIILQFWWTCDFPAEIGTDVFPIPSCPCRIPRSRSRCAFVSRKWSSSRTRTNLQYSRQMSLPFPKVRHIIYTAIKFDWEYHILWPIFSIASTVLTLFNTRKRFLHRN